MNLRALMARDHERTIAAAGGMGETVTLLPRGDAPGQPLRVLIGEQASPGTATGEAMLIQQRMVPVTVRISEARLAILAQEGAARDLAPGDVLVSAEGRLVVESLWPDGLGWWVVQCRGTDAVGATSGRIL